MPHHLCVTCGAQFSDSDRPPPGCPVCQDERQYVGRGGQRWTTPERLAAAHACDVREEEPSLSGIGMKPSFAIGQRALLVEHPDGNVLWDCIPLVDAAAVDHVRARGGLAAIALSHPHYYTGMVEWSRAFGGVPIHLHAADRRWVMRPDPAIRFWEGDRLELGDGLTLHRLGGHFPGGAVLHWAAGAEGNGALLCGDVIQVIPDRRFVSFMYSYPNLIPLPGEAVRRIAAAVAPLAFDRLYGAWFDRVVPRDAHAAVQRSAARYQRALAGDLADAS